MSVCKLCGKERTILKNGRGGEYVGCANCKANRPAPVPEMVDPDVAPAPGPPDKAPAPERKTLGGRLIERSGFKLYRSE
jgi:hypothetical protein